jgi:hypothetical protein
MPTAPAPTLDACLNGFLVLSMVFPFAFWP